MKMLFPLFAVATMLVGCEKIEGQLNVVNDVKLVSTRGVSKTISVGTYTADIKANTKKKITLRLNNDRDEKFEFNVPAGSLPSNGTFSYKSATVGQPVDLSGSVATTVTQSARRQTYESCQYQEPVQVCYPAPNGGTHCSIQYQTRYGSRWVEFYDQQTDKSISLSIASAGSGVESAQFQGDISWIDRIILNQSQCR